MVEGSTGAQNNYSDKYLRVSIYVATIHVGIVSLIMRKMKTCLQLEAFLFWWYFYQGDAS